MRKSDFFSPEGWIRRLCAQWQRERVKLRSVHLQLGCKRCHRFEIRKEVADYIGSEHTEVIITKEDVLSALEDVIGLLGTFDITTIRASIGMYLVCKAIHEQTDIRVLLTGEISDELFGYKYTDFAPSAQAFQKESEKRVRELHMYDVLRADRCISVNSLEARVPFGDLDFVRYVMAIDPEKSRMCIGKENICSAMRLRKGTICRNIFSGEKRQHFRMRWDILW